MTQMSTPHIHKTSSGAVVIRGGTDKVRAGAILSVAPLSGVGVMRTVTIDHIGDPFQGESGEWLVYGYLTPAPKRRTSRAASRAATPVRRTPCRKYICDGSCGDYDHQ